MIPLGVLGATGPSDGILAMDSFTRADNASSMGVAERGGSWVTTGTWGILSNRARCYSADTFATLNTGVSSEFKAQVDLFEGRWPCLVFRYQDNWNCYWLEYEASYIYLVRLLGGARTNYTSVNGLTGAQTLHLEVTESGGGTEISFWTASSPTPVVILDSDAGRPTGTRAGFRGQNFATRGDFDNFLVERL